MKDEVERAVEPLRRDIEDLKAENTKRDAAIEELKHELATLNIYLSTWGVMKVKTCKTCVQYHHHRHEVCWCHQTAGPK